MPNSVSTEIKTLTLDGVQYSLNDTTARAALLNKQDTLVSGTSIKTINNESILGSGNITITGGNSDNECEIITLNSNNSNGLSKTDSEILALQANGTVVFLVYSGGYLQLQPNASVSGISFIGLTSSGMATVQRVSNQAEPLLANLVLLPQEIPTNISSFTNDSGYLTSSTGVSSFNGQTGSVTYSAPVTSVNGRTGVVSVSELPSVSSSDNGNILIVSSGSWTTTHPVTIYSGSSAPASNTGSNGDIYIQTES